jgi:hypothetical protein
MEVEDMARLNDEEEDMARLNDHIATVLNQHAGAGDLWDALRRLLCTGESTPCGPGVRCMNLMPHIVFNQDWLADRLGDNTLTLQAVREHLWVVVLQHVFDRFGITAALLQYAVATLRPIVSAAAADNNGPTVAMWSYRWVCSQAGYAMFLYEARLYNNAHSIERFLAENEPGPLLVSLSFDLRPAMGYAILAGLPPWDWQAVPLPEQDEDRLVGEVAAIALE